MCALVQAIRKTGIVGGGPGLGAAANPMHIVRTVDMGNKSQSTLDIPSTSLEDTSFGQSRRIVEDPTTQVDDDRPAQQGGYEYYSEDNLDGQLLSGTTAVKQQIEEEALQQRNEEIERGRSFGRRRKTVRVVDLEKGQGH